jgi:predicted transcriptional regulator
MRERQRQQTFDGKKARKLRISMGLSVQDVADQVGVSKWAIYSYERRIANPKPPAYRKLTEIYGVDRLDLWVDEDASGSAA